MSLDATDEQLVNLLLADGRATIRSLSEAVGIPESTTRDRIRSLEDRGIIHGYHAKVDPRALGLRVVSWIFVDVRHDQATEFAEFANRQPAILRGHAMQHKPGAFALKVAAQTSQKMTHTLQHWAQRFDFKVRDMLLVDEVQARRPIVEEKTDDALVLGALSEKI